MLFAGTFERNDRAFLEHFLQPGMTMIDVGGHAGVYTLVAARLVGPLGRVITFEPSPRERDRLVTHLRLNRLANVTVEPLAVGADEGEVDLFVVEDSETGCNSLRQQGVGRTRAIRVPMCRLDTYVFRQGVPHVDFIKMDIEGGERDALLGAAELFRRDRPVLLCEVEDARIRPWGYEPHEIVELVEGWGYEWFELAEAGTLTRLTSRSRPSGNYVARPNTSCPAHQEPPVYRDVIVFSKG